jgi:hypothetical protein
MPSSQLKRAERSIQTIRDQGELPPETADAPQELVDAIRAIEGRLSGARRRDIDAHRSFHQSAKRIGMNIPQADITLNAVRR